METKKKSCVTEVYSRITGYFSSLSQWNKGKVEEWKNRKKFDKSSKDYINEKPKV